MQKLRKDVYEKHIASQSWIARIFNTKQVQTDIVERIMRQRIFAFPSNYNKDMLQWAINTAFQANDLAALHIYHNTFTHYPETASDETKKRICDLFNMIKQHKMWETILETPLSQQDFALLHKVYTNFISATTNYEKWFLLETLLRTDKILFDKYNILHKPEPVEHYLYAWMEERVVTAKQKYIIKDTAEILKKYNRFNKYLQNVDTKTLQTFNEEFYKGNGKIKKE